MDHLTQIENQRLATLRDERKQDRRRLVMEQFYQAALPLIKEKGIDGISIAEITEAAGYSKGSLYNYFASKEEFIGESLRWSLKKFLAAIESIVSSPLPPFSQQLVELRLYLQSTFNDAHKLMFAQAFNLASLQSEQSKGCYEKLQPLLLNIRTIIADFFQRGMDEGIVHSIDPQRLSTFFIHAVVGQGIFDRYHTLGELDSRANDSFYDQLFSLMILRPQQGTQEEITLHV